MSTYYHGPPEGYRLERAPDPEGSWAAGWWALVQIDTGERVALVRGDRVGLLSDRDRDVAFETEGKVRMKPGAAAMTDAEWAISEYGEPVLVGDLRRGVAP